MIRGIRPRGSRQLATPLAPHSRLVGAPSPGPGLPSGIQTPVGAPLASGSEPEPRTPFGGQTLGARAIPAPQEWLEPSEPARRPGDLLREKAKKAAVTKKRLSDETIEAVIDRLARRLASEP